MRRVYVQLAGVSFPIDPFLGELLLANGALGKGWEIKMADTRGENESHLVLIPPSEAPWQRMPESDTCLHPAEMVSAKPHETGFVISCRCGSNFYTSLYRGDEDER